MAEKLRRFTAKHYLIEIKNGIFCLSGGGRGDLGAAGA